MSWAIHKLNLLRETVDDQKQPQASATTDTASEVVWNVPNVLSMFRLVFAAAVFVLLPLGFYASALVMFLVSAATDFVDGWWARRFNQITKLGRVLDPFCDKILVCGTFILLAVEMNGAASSIIPPYARIAGWMAVVVVARELLVTALRSAVEGSGGDFSAKMAGKLKMWFQCIAIVAAFVALLSVGEVTVRDAFEQPKFPWWLAGIMVLANWTAVLSTLWSGWGYVRAAAPMFRNPVRQE